MYYIMHKDFSADWLKDAVSYGDYKLSGTKPMNFTGEVVQLNSMGFDDSGEDGLTLTQLTITVDAMMAEIPTGKLIEASDAQGKALYYNNHPVFKPAQTNEI